MLTVADKDKFINDGPFFERYPEIYPLVTRYERTDRFDRVVESWERGDDGRMHETTERDKAREELRRAQEELNKLQMKEALI